MISKRIEYLLWMLATDNTQLAAYAGCSESNFSRLKSGSRKPSRDSLTIKKFVRAVCQAADEKKLTDTLRTLVKAPDAEGEELYAAVTEWIFDPQDSSLPHTPWGINSKQFGEKLSAVMIAAGISSSKLSRLVNIDPSYISRMRNGSRMPKNNPSLIYRICSIIAAKAFEKGSHTELFELTGQPEGDERALTSALFGWLYDKRSTEGSLAVGRLIDKIAAIPEGGNGYISQHPEIPPQNDKAKVYFGIQGLQNAVIRFLSAAAKAGNRHLMLYSDQPMRWMTSAFCSVWEELMKACLENGVKMTIVHNIDRQPAELFEAIIRWMPLYMTGLIEPYYCTLSAGERQYTTIFIDEGHACVEGNFVRGMEKEARYRYITSPDELSYAQKNFEMVLLDCKPLIKIVQVDGLALTGRYNIFSSGDTQIYINESEVIVQQLRSPRLSFCFENPIMVKTFKRFIEERSIY